MSAIGWAARRPDRTWHCFLPGRARSVCGFLALGPLRLLGQPAGPGRPCKVCERKAASLGHPLVWPRWVTAAAYFETVMAGLPGWPSAAPPAGSLADAELAAAIDALGARLLAWEMTATDADVDDVHDAAADVASAWRRLVLSAW